MKHHFFKHFAYEFETRHTLWYAPYGGSDFAEVSHICEQIKPENDATWYQAWYKAASNLENQADALTSPQSQGLAHLRASRYFQAAEFFLNPQDPRKIEAYEKSVSNFYAGLDKLAIAYQMITVPFQHTSARSLFFQPKKAARATLFICGGFDALLEELYFTHVQAALAEGYQVVLFEGPGQSHLLRYEHLPFNPHWETICQEVLDYYRDHDLLGGPVIGLGLSLGGLLMARAQAANNQLFDGLVLQNYFPSLLDSFKYQMPAFLHPFIDKGFPNFLLPFCNQFIKRQHFLNWQIQHASWTFGQTNLNGLLKTCRQFEEPDRLSCPCLVFVAEDENYYDYQQGIAFAKSLSHPKSQVALMTKADDPSALHCQNGAAFASNQILFEWLVAML